MVNRAQFEWVSHFDFYFAQGALVGPSAPGIGGVWGVWAFAQGALVGAIEPWGSREVSIRVELGGDASPVSPRLPTARGAPVGPIDDA